MFYVLSALLDFLAVMLFHGLLGVKTLLEDAQLATISASLVRSTDVPDASVGQDSTTAGPRLVSWFRFVKNENTVEESSVVGNGYCCRHAGDTLLEFRIICSKGNIKLEKIAACTFCSLFRFELTERLCVFVLKRLETNNGNCYGGTGEGLYTRRAGADAQRVVQMGKNKPQSSYKTFFVSIFSFYRFIRYSHSHRKADVLREATAMKKLRCLKRNPRC